MKEQVKEIIESISGEILQCVIGNSAVAFETVLYPEKDCMKS